MTNRRIWVFVRVLRTVQREQPALFDAQWAEQVGAMIAEAVDCETLFADDVLTGGVVGRTTKKMRQYLEYVADQHLQCSVYRRVTVRKIHFHLWNCRACKS